MQNDVLDMIRKRRSIRNFTEQLIPREVLTAIAEAGRNAPTARNGQTRILTVITDPALILRTEKALRTSNQRDSDYTLYGARAVVVCAESRDDGNGLANCACAMQNMMLAAASLGVGSVWINQFKNVCDDPQIRMLLHDLSIPDSHVAWMALALGYAAAPAEDKPKDGMTIHWL